MINYVKMIDHKLFIRKIIMNSNFNYPITTDLQQRALGHLALENNIRRVDSPPSVLDPDIRPPELKLTSPLLANFEYQEILKTPFHLTVEEEALVLQIVRHVNIATELSLFDVLIFDLHCQMQGFKNFVREEDVVGLQQNFKLKAIKLIQTKRPESTTEFITFIDGLCGLFLRSIQRRYQTSHTSSTHELTEDKTLFEKKNADTRLLLQTLRCRTLLLSKFLTSASAFPLLLSPLRMYKECERIEKHLPIKTTTPFYKMADFFEFALESASLVDPSLNDKQRLVQVREYIHNFAKPANKKAGQDVNEFFNENETWLKGRSPYLSAVLYALLCGCLGHRSDQDLNSAQFYNSDRCSQFLLGNIPSIQDILVLPEGAADKLALFKAEGSISPQTHLTAEEATLIDELIEQHPLESDLTMMDLIAFALNERLIALEEDIEHDFHDQLNTIRRDQAADYYMLYVGFARQTPSTIAVLGAITPHAATHHLLPANFITRTEYRLRLVENLYVSPKTKKYAYQGNNNRKALKACMTKKILPLKDLWVKLLQSQDHRTLLLRTISMYVGGEKMDRESGGQKATLKKYWRFHQQGYTWGVERRMIGVSRNFSTFDDLISARTPPDHQKLEEFRVSIAALIVALSKIATKSHLELTNAIDRKITHASWLVTHQISSSRPKSQLEFIEQLHANWTTSNLNLSVALDFLQLCEKCLFPKGTLSTKSCYFRLTHNLLFYMDREQSKDTKVKREWNNQEIENIFSSIEMYFSLPPFQMLLEFMQTHQPSRTGNFEYPAWLKELEPLKETVKSLFDKTLHSLSLLPTQLREKLKRRFSSLTIEELRAIKIESIQESLFNDCIELLPPLLILSDILALLQVRHFYEEAALIPPELAEVMELEGIGEMIESLIREKTAQVVLKTDQIEFTRIAKEKEEDQVSAVPATLTGERSDGTPMIPSQPTPLMASGPPIEQRKEKTKKAALIESSSTSSTSSTSEDTYGMDHADFLEIKTLTKSRKILEKLERMGLSIVRKTSSHNILHSNTGAQVVVPNNTNLPAGTVKSIANQTRNAMMPKNA